MPLDLSRNGNLEFHLPMMRGIEVLNLQRALIPNYLAPGSDDGLFGPVTREAVKALQRDLGLPATGVVDATTKKGLKRVAPAPHSQVAPIVNPGDLPDAHAERVILHWTGGSDRASEIDRKCYHFLVEQDGTIVKGVHGIDANDRPVSGRYAAHTLNKNTRSVGVSLCGMHEAVERPFSPGPKPITERQVQVMARLVAQICVRYGIPVGRTTVLGHGEVQDLLGVAQEQKWDPLVLPWRRELSFREVGDMMRAMVQAEIDRGLPDSPATEPEMGEIALEIAGRELTNTGVLFDEAVRARLKRLVDHLGWTLLRVEADGALVKAGDLTVLLPVVSEPGDEEGSLLVRLDDLAEELELVPHLADEGDRIRLEGTIGGTDKSMDGKTFHTVTVQRGDTLWRIAQRALGDGSRWHEIRTEAGQPFDEQRARRIRPHEVVLVPKFTAAEPLQQIEVDDELFAAIGAAAALVAHPLNRDAAREATPRIARACFRHGVTDLSHIAYIFATAEHETNFGRQMTEIWRNSPAQRRYENNASNKQKGDGKRYRGRGYVQLTFRENYRKFEQALGKPLEGKPELAANPDIAADILVLGMSRIGYRSSRLVLPRFGADGDFDFGGARSIVNADRDRFENRYGETVGIGVGNNAQAYRRAMPV